MGIYFLFEKKINLHWKSGEDQGGQRTWIFIGERQCLKKLRRKFIAIAMLSVSIVLIAIVGTINIANYISTNQALDARLSLIADNGGTFPGYDTRRFWKKLEPKSDQPPAMNDLQKHGISQESPFDTRYFTVTIAPDGTVESVDTGKIASISAGTAEEYARSCGKRKEKRIFR